MESLGNHGEIVNVKAGYARNYLIPYDLAEVATPEAKERIEREHVLREKREEERREQLREMAKSLETSSCTITAQANEEGHLFGSVTPQEIAAAFVEDGVELEEEQIILETPIKEIGVYGFKIRLLPEIEVNSKVWVVKE